MRKQWIAMWWLVLLCSWCSMPVLAADEAGKVLAARGAVSAVQGGGTRALTAGSAVYGSETIHTAASAAVQVRFSDGTLVSLPGSSEFRVDEYQFGAGEHAFFTLLKGGLRTLTGKIGHKNRDNYRMNTPVATIGIRGTDYQLRLCLDDCPTGYANGLYLSVIAGAILASNEAGEYPLHFGESAFIPIWTAPLQKRPDIPQPLPVSQSGNNGTGDSSASGGGSGGASGGGSDGSTGSTSSGDAGTASVGGGGGGGGGSNTASSPTGTTLNSLSSGPVTMFDGITAGQVLEFRAADVIRCVR